MLFHFFIRADDLVAVIRQHVDRVIQRGIVIVAQPGHPRGLLDGPDRRGIVDARGRTRIYQRDPAVAELLQVDHPIRSVVEATLFIELTEEEQFAILYHDGLYGSLAYEIKGRERPLQTLLHFADYWSSQFDEGKSLPKEEENE